MPKVVIIGGGFAGLRLARELRGAPVETLVIDRRNHHAFQPLFYEVATAGLDPGDIAQPIRSILRDIPNASFRLAEATTFDFARKRVMLADDEFEEYDFLVIAAGSTTAFFGLESAPAHARGLKSLADALAIRDRLFLNYELAAQAADPAVRRELTRMLVVGGGPTGVEMAGALAELQRHVLARDYPDLKGEAQSVLLIEASSDLLMAAMPPRLRRKALAHLQELGVQVRLNAQVEEVTGRGVLLRGGEQISTANVVWVAGVEGVEIARAVDIELDRIGRIVVEPTLQISGHHEVFAIGDIAALREQILPMVAPVALQQASLTADNIKRLLTGLTPRAFLYKDRGSMTTIGRSRAVANVFNLQVSGILAWWMWLGLHLYQIIGLRNRAIVLLNWLWNYVTYDRAHRVVLEEHRGQPRVDS